MAPRRWIWMLALLPLLAAAETEDGPLDPAREELAKKMLEFEARQSALKALETDIDRKIEELRELREQALAVIEPREKERAAQLATLIKFYEAMKPKSAAELLEKLPVELAAEVLGSMKSRGAGKILNVMNADRAVRISRLMAGRK